MQQLDSLRLLLFLMLVMAITIVLVLVLLMPACAIYCPLQVSWRRVDSLEKTLMLGGIGFRKRRG